MHVQLITHDAFGTRIIPLAEAEYDELVDLRSRINGLIAAADVETMALA